MPIVFKEKMVDELETTGKHFDCDDEVFNSFNSFNSLFLMFVFILIS